ncbi:MAG: TonB family protein [Candidatus Kapabacteria bacterium]|nr:TonB family protein [Candidatus Kapabacteria bacterium]
MLYRDPESKQLIISIPWDSNTFRGFLMSLVVTILIVLLGPFVEFAPPPEFVTPPYIKDTTAIMILYAGVGIKNAPSKGDGIEEGAAKKAPLPSSRMDNVKSPKFAVKKATAAKHSTTELTPRIIPVKRVPEKKSDTKPSNSTATENTTTKKNNVADNSSSESTGVRNGSANGTGKSTQGTGGGLGKGFYDIEWGGGGNSIPINKVIPKVPAGLNNSTIVRLTFTVSKDGDIIFVKPKTKGNPVAENTALAAFKLWKFKPPTTQTALQGTITFKFDVN